MEKKGVDGFLDSKEAKVSVLLLFSIIMVFVLTLSMSSVFVSAMNVTLFSPGNFTFNTTSSRNINFTFNATWTLGGADPSPVHENISNCSLWVYSADQEIGWNGVYNTSKE